MRTKTVRIPTTVIKMIISIMQIGVHHRATPILNNLYSPNSRVKAFSEVRALFLLSDNGNRAVGVPNYGLRYAAHKRSP